MPRIHKNVKLEKVCPDCSGKGGETELGEFFPCDECKGAGYVPTANGKAVLAIMRHNFPWMLREQRRVVYR
jgi:DnaJ-class molecular chaperone